MSAHGRARRHWWLERLTSIALIPLSLWLIVSLASQNLADHATFAQWIGQRSTLIGLSLFFLAALYHARLGLEVIMDDYISTPERNRIAQRASRVVLLVALLAAFAGLLHFLP